MIDEPFAVTFFTDYAAATNRREALTLRELAARIARTSAPAKEHLPWLKLATFGDVRSRHGSLRHDANMVSISGVEVDYDGEEISFDDAVVIIEKAGLEALLYTSPSHQCHGHGPRWRGLFRCAREYPPEHRDHFVCRVAGLFRDGNLTVLSAESWTRSQSYYFGAVAHNPEHRVKLIDGERLDELDELDQIALGKPATKSTGPGEPAGPADEDALLDQIVTGKSYHTAAIRLLGVWARRGVAMLEASRRLREAFDAASVHDQRWRDRVAEIPRPLDAIWGREAKKADAREEEFSDWLAQQPPLEEEDRGTSTSWASPLPPAEPWPEMDAEAFYGLAGDVVDAISPTTEADPVAILAHFLVEAGNAVGRKPYCLADGARHYPNLYALVVGDTSKGRKGTAARRVEQVTGAADSDWHLHCIVSGLSSGEGVIHAVHDEIRGREKTGKGKQTQYVEVVKHPGVADKRLLIHEPEFAGALEVMKREGSILSRIVREGYDTGTLRVLTKNAPEKATGVHLSIIGHITVDEYRVSLDRTSMVNGYANRFVNFLVRRAQELPFGGTLDDRVATVLADRTRAALGNTALWQQITFSPAAAELWVAHYHDLSAARPGLFGSVTARGEAHTLRLALLYAVLDERRQIDPAHLRAALAVWQYCEASARYIFRDYLGDPLADEILNLLRQAGPGGMTRTELYDMLGRHRPSKRTSEALSLLSQHGKARRIARPTSGRPVEIWTAI